MGPSQLQASSRMLSANNAVQRLRLPRPSEHQRKVVELDFFRCDRRGEQISLHAIDAELHHLTGLGWRLNPLSDYFIAHCLSDSADQFYETHLSDTIKHRTHEGLVDLDGLDVQARKIAQRREARTKVVQGNRDACFGQPFEVRSHQWVSVYNNALRQFKRQQVRRNAVPSQSPLYLGKKRFAMELCRAHIHADHYFLPRFQPLCRLGTCGVQDKKAKFVDVPCPLSSRDEVLRGN